MSLIIPVFLAAMMLLYLALLLAGSLTSGEFAAADRLKLVTLTLEALLILFLARVLIPWTPATSWLWVAALGGVGAGIGLALRAAPGLPWFAAKTRGRLALRRVGAPAYAGLLAVGASLLYATLW